MKPYPRLTIGIPTYNRPDRLPIAIESALAQQQPAIVLVADQTGDAEEVVSQYLNHPCVRYLRTNATCLWENWTAAAEACDTEFFLWLQDDDKVSSKLSSRVALAFDRYPTAKVYLACLALSFVGGEGNWWQRTGPMVPMNLTHGLPTPVRGSLIIAAGYFTSWALSPGMAFRWSLDAVEAIRNCPKDCDLYNERLVLAELCRNGDAVCDPAVMGYWVQHDDNESKRQVKAGKRGPQFHRLVAHLDRLLEGRTDWHDALRAWAINIGRSHIRDWLRETGEDEATSPIYDEARAILLESLKIWIDLEPKKSDETSPALSPTPTPEPGAQPTHEQASRPPRKARNAREQHRAGRENSRG